MMTTENHVLVEIGVQGLTLRKEVPDAWSGGNPIFHAMEARKVADKVVEELDALIASHYGDIRARRDESELGPLESKNIRIQQDLWDKAMKKATDEGTNVSSVVRRLLKEWAA